MVVDGDSPRPSGLVWQYVLVNLHRPWIDARDLVAAEFHEIRYARGAHDHSIGSRPRRRRRHDLDVTSLRIESANHVRALHREPERPLLVEDRRMWVARN